MIPSPTLTVIIPTHTARGFLAAALASAIRNLQADDEVLIVANGASAEYVAEVAAMVRAPARLIVVAETGVAHARNAGLREAHGAFVLFLDDDDLLIDGGVDILRRALEAHPTWNGVAGGIVWFDEHHSGQSSAYTVNGTLLTPVRLLGHSIASPGSVVLRTDVVRRLGGFHQEFAPAEDFDLWLRVAADGPLVGMPAPMLRYRVHATAASANVLRMGAQALTVFQRHAGGYGAPPFTSSMRRAAMRIASYYRYKLLVAGRRYVKASQWTSALATAVLLIRFLWLSLHYRARAEFWQLVDRSAPLPTPSQAETIPYRDQSTSTLDVDE